MQRFRFERRLDESDMPQDKKIIFKPMQPNQELIEEVEHRIFIMLGVLNGIIFVIAGLLGYLLAGLTLKPIQDMMEEQNRFISDASHELKTPLTSLKTAMEVYLREKKPSVEESKVLVKESIEEVNKMQTLSESLLQLAQYQQPNLKVHMSKISLTESIDSAVHKVHLLAKNKEIIITSEGKDIEIEANKQSLTDLFLILLDNAIKYSPSKSTVTIAAEKTDGHIKIQVSDEGNGIHEKDMPHIFDRFYRADEARSRHAEGGYGLGLSIAKKIVEAHAGTISVLNNPEKGATFIVTIPITRSAKFQI